MFLKRKKQEMFVPADVPQEKAHEFIINYNTITQEKNRLLLFSVDQKIEHLNVSFYGPTIAPEDNNPEHLFRIASQGSVGAMATQLGLIARYGKQYPNINYIVKLNSKTNIVKTEQQDPISKQLWSIEQVVAFKQQTNLPIRGIGYTIYLGSAFETEMLTQAAKAIFEAHQHGLITILWMYPRGKNVHQERDGYLIAGAAGVANALGSDFAKVNSPEASEGKTSEKWLAIAAQAAGNTKLLCSGGSAIAEKNFLETLQLQLHKGNTAGAAIGRNIHQKSLNDAITFTKKLSALIYDKK